MGVQDAEEKESDHGSGNEESADEETNSLEESILPRKGTHFSTNY